MPQARVAHPRNVNRTKQIMGRAYPRFIDQEYPAFVEFMEAYFEWLDQTGNPAELIKQLRDYRDIDRTVEDFVEYFRKEFMVYIPADVLADKVLLIKHIKQFYQSKGNEKSFKFLFRILYNEDIELYYPKIDILRASDGKWVEEKSIKVTNNYDDDLSGIESRLIYGKSSSAKALIERALRYDQQGITVVELFLSNIKGSFQYGETVEILDEFDRAITSETVYALFSGVTITEKGSQYRIDDPFVLRDAHGNVISTGRINSIEKGRVETLTVVDGGRNYSGQFRIASLFSSLPINYVWNGTPLSEEALSIYASQQIGLSIESMSLGFTGIGDEITFRDSEGFGAAGIVTRVNDQGAIQAVKLTRRGISYVDPIPEVHSDFGEDAILAATTSSGQVKAASLITFAIEVPGAYLDFTGRGNGAAQGTVGLVTLAEYPGRWLNSDGHLDSDKRLQDNYYWQDFSYVIKGDVQISKYRDFVKSILHPAGLQMFGELSALIGPTSARLSLDNTPPLERINIILDLAIVARGITYSVFTDDIPISLMSDLEILGYEDVGPGDALVPPISIISNLVPSHAATDISIITDSNA